MKVSFFDLKRQYEQLAPAVEPKVLEVLRSCAYVGGPYVAELEKSLAVYLGVKHVVTCANGTDAITLAVRACGIMPGDEVITTPFSFFATAEAIAVAGAVPVFVDIREDDLNIDPAKIEAAITEKTKAIMPVHIFGQPAAMDEIGAIAKKHNLRVIEDAAQAIGAEYKGKKIGTVGDVTTFSFYPTKNLGAFGDAGMVTTNDDTLAVVLRSFREHGAGKNGAMAREAITGKPEVLETGEKADGLYDPYKYYNYLNAYNSRLDAVQAVILNEKLPHLDTYNEKRAAIAAFYGEHLHGVRVPVEMPGTHCCWHQYAIRTDKKFELVDYLGGQGIGVGAFYPVPLHLQKAFDSLGYKEGSLPVAEQVCRESVCLPIYPELTREEQEAVVAAINAFFA